MKVIQSLTLLFLAITSCERAKEVQISETRRLTTKDTNVKLDATSDERFRDAKPAPFKSDVPNGWLALPSTQFRLMNYRFGESGLGEVFMSVAGGSVVDNINRWNKQFGGADLTAEQIAALPTLTMLGETARVIEAKGTYASGMGQQAKPGYALYGAMAAIDGQLYTVKMVGPENEVATAKTAAAQWIESLKKSD